MEAFPYPQPSLKDRVIKVGVHVDPGFSWPDGKVICQIQVRDSEDNMIRKTWFKQEVCVYYDQVARAIREIGRWMDDDAKQALETIIAKMPSGVIENGGFVDMASPLNI